MRLYICDLLNSQFLRCFMNTVWWRLLEQLKFQSYRCLVYYAPQRGKYIVDTLSVRPVTCPTNADILNKQDI